MTARSGLLGPSASPIRSTLPSSPVVPFWLYWKVLERVSAGCAPEQPLYTKIGRDIGISRAVVVLGSSGVVTTVDIEFGEVMPNAFCTKLVCQ